MLAGMEFRWRKRVRKSLLDVSIIQFLIACIYESGVLGTDTNLRCPSFSNLCDDTLYEVFLRSHCAESCGYCGNGGGRRTNNRTGSSSKTTSSPASTKTTIRIKLSTTKTTAKPINTTKTTTMKTTIVTPLTHIIYVRCENETLKRGSGESTSAASGEAMNERNTRQFAFPTKVFRKIPKQTTTPSSQMNATEKTPKMAANKTASFLGNSGNASDSITTAIPSSSTSSPRSRSETPDDYQLVPLPSPTPGPEEVECGLFPL